LKARTTNSERDFLPKRFTETSPETVVLDSVVPMTWNSSSMQRYIELGYTFTFIGDSFVVAVEHLSRGSPQKVNVQCPLCHKTRLAANSTFSRVGHTYCVGCSRTRDLRGERFGRLIAVSFLGGGKSIWTCDCDCGARTDVAAGELLRGGIKSCGCARDEYMSNRPRGIDNPGWLRIEVECPVCGCLFFVKNSENKKAKNNFCSVSCKAKWQSMFCVGEKSPGWNRVKLFCTNCGDEFYRVRHRAGKAKVGRFCSARCWHKYASETLRGVNHYQWTSSEVSCDHCGELFFKKMNAISEKNFCSKKHFQEYNRGANNYSYNKNLSDDDREKGRTSWEYKLWIKAIYERFDGACILCGDRRNIVAHHLYSYAEYPEKRLDIDNGVVLCRDHHNQFHFAFMGGTCYPCTKEDFVEWARNLSFDINEDIN
jgi:hypothetical protein